MQSIEKSETDVSRYAVLKPFEDLSEVREVQVITSFPGQGEDENRTIDQTLDLGWSLLSMLPIEELDRVDKEMLEKHYDPEKAKMFKG